MMKQLLNEWRKYLKEVSFVDFVGDQQNQLKNNPQYKKFYESPGETITIPNSENGKDNRNFFNEDGSERAKFNIPGTKNWLVKVPQENVQKLSPSPVTQTQEKPSAPTQNMPVVAPQGVYFYRVLRNEGKDRPLLYVTTKKNNKLKKVNPALAKSFLEKYLATPKDNLGILTTGYPKKTSTGAYFLASPNSDKYSTTLVDGFIGVIVDKGNNLIMTEPGYTFDRYNKLSLSKKDNIRRYSEEPTGWTKEESNSWFPTYEGFEYTFYTLIGSKKYRNVIFTILDSYIQNLLSKFSSQNNI